MNLRNQKYLNKCVPYYTVSVPTRFMTILRVGSVSFSDMEEYDPELREFYEDVTDDEDW